VLDDDVEALVASEVHQLLLVRFVVVVEHLKNEKWGICTIRLILVKIVSYNISKCRT
jgi:hypothetical protein